MNQKSIVTRFEDFINQNYLKLHKKKVIIALSTGVDSSVLLDVVEKMAIKYDFEIIICHVNHKIRQQSDIEENYVINTYGEKHPVYIYRFNESDKKAYNDSNFQEYARIKRLEFFSEVASKENVKYVLLAHHLNDDIETSLFRLIRGASLNAICGIRDVQEWRNITILRPFLTTLKKDLIEYAKENDVKYYEDSSNNGDNYERNRIRHNIVTNIFKENPSFENNYLIFKERLKYASSLVDEKRDKYIHNHIKSEKKRLNIDYNSFIKLDHILQEEVLFEILKKYQFSLVNIKDIIKIINIGNNGLF